ncbi:hypothetical protein CYMTET_28976, partial [Cymbomonas tetramitiformis]
DWGEDASARCAKWLHPLPPVAPVWERVTVASEEHLQSAAGSGREGAGRNALDANVSTRQRQSLHVLGLQFIAEGENNALPASGYRFFLRSEEEFEKIYGVKRTGNRMTSTQAVSRAFIA